MLDLQTESSVIQFFIDAFYVIFPLLLPNISRQTLPNQISWNMANIPKQPYTVKMGFWPELLLHILHCTRKACRMFCSFGCQLGFMLSNCEYFLYPFCLFKLPHSKVFERSLPNILVIFVNAEF